VEFQRQAEPNLLFSGKKMVKINAPKKSDSGRKGSLGNHWIRLWDRTGLF
jgi:hypothetical protein